MERPLRPPAGQVLRINPGRLPESAEMEGLTYGFMEVREVVARETAGAVSPRKQLEALDTLLQRIHDAIANVMVAANDRNASALSADDAVRLVAALVEYGTMAYNWLLIGRPLKRLPPKPGSFRPDLSQTKSTASRRAVLRRIEQSFVFALQLMDQLWEIRPPAAVYEAVDRGFRSQIMCVRILARLVVADTTRKPVPSAQLRRMLAEINLLRLHADFGQRSEGDRNRIWQTAGRLYQELGDADGVRRSFTERRALAVNSLSARAHLLLDMLATADDDADRLALMHDLRSLAATANLGPLFSRERAGLLSIQRSVVWDAAISTAVGGGYADAAVAAALECYEQWAYGGVRAADAQTISIIGDWLGRGRVVGVERQRAPVKDFDLDLEIANRFFFSVGGTKAATRTNAEKMAGYLDREIGTRLAEILPAKGEVRLRTGGLADVLPLLMAQTNGKPLGASPRVAYAHPKPPPQGAAAPRTPRLLLVIDDCFALSAGVKTTFLVAARERNETLDVLGFNSNVKGRDLDHQELRDRLHTASVAVMFCHFQTVSGQAEAASLITGQASRLRAEELAAMDFGSVEELVLVGCGSGRPDPFVGNLTLANAAAIAGARQVISTLWAIEAKEGAAFLTALRHAWTQYRSTAELIAQRYLDDRIAAGAFTIMRP